MNLRQTVMNIFYAGAVLTVAFAWAPGEARANQTKPAKTNNAAPARATQPAATRGGGAATAGSGTRTRTTTTGSGTRSGGTTTTGSGTRSGGTTTTGSGTRSGGTTTTGSGTRSGGTTTAGSGTRSGGTTTTGSGTTTAGSGTRNGGTTTTGSGTRSGGTTTAGSGTRSGGTTTTGSGTRSGGTTTVGSGTRGGSTTTGRGGITTGRGMEGGRMGPAVYQKRPGEGERSLPGGGREFRDPQTNRMVTTNARGEVRRIEAPRGLAGNRMVINRGPRGGRVVESGRPGARVVSYGSRRGFVERPLRQGYISRTYVAGGRSYAHVYREGSYHGFAYYHYVPAVYYGSGFYAWAGTPWGVPARYSWGGAIAAPWLGFYAGYFTPYQAYVSPDQWLTDYLLAQNLRQAYDNQQAGNAEQAAPPMPDAQAAAAPVSPEIKALIADEVRQQLAAERAAALQPASTGPQPPPDQPPAALNQRFFVVSSNLDIATAGGQTCSLTPGDIIQRRGKDVMPDGGVAMEIVSSKPGDCATDSPATVQLADLQEMHNQFREQLDSGLQMLADNQAKGLPNGPAAGTRPVAEGTAVPAPDAESQLATQETDAAKLEAQVRQAGGSN